MMRLSTFAVLLILAASSTNAANVEEGLSVELMSKFKHWTDYHHKTYDSHDEKMQRLSIWLDNHELIEKHNSQQPVPTFTLGHNAFSDMTEQEFAAHFKLGEDYSKKAAASKMHSEEAASTARRRTLEDVAPLELPDYVNWVDLGAVTPIKNQGACGSCWAFSTTGALEGAKFLKTGELVALSEQNLLDCDHVDLGCSGGLMDNAFKFDEKSGGLCSETDYPYQAKQNKICNTNCTDVPGSIVKTFIDVPTGNAKALVSAVAMQPISIAIEASGSMFQFYKNGVLTDDACGKRGSIDHGVLAVGYGTDLDTQSPYFLVKNSWGASWGDHGYVKIGRKSANKFGICSILKMASFPEVE
jgi:cathepsin L